MQSSKGKKIDGFYMVATINALGTSTQPFKTKYFKYQMYLLLQLIVTYTNSYRRMFADFR